ncbi:DUF6151 family protein [Rhodobacteraceae bacterium]|nr:DUF6151 family protein [Paracoccaceae bacterium]
MSNETTWTCDCGAVEARLAPVTGTRCICYCASCQAFLRHLDRYELADDAGGTDLFQTTPDKVTFVKGDGNLKALRLSDKGPIRWSTTCCNTPMGNTAPKRVVPFVGFLVRSIKDPELIGPILARVHRKDATAHVEGDAGSMRRLILSFIGRALPVLATGKYKKTPFFDASGRAVAKPERQNDAERALAYGG